VALEFVSRADKRSERSPKILKIEVSYIGLLINMELQCIKYFKQLYFLPTFGVKNILECGATVNFFNRVEIQFMWSYEFTKYFYSYRGASVDSTNTYHIKYTVCTVHKFDLRTKTF
jgi:hypothetical protein